MGGLRLSSCSCSSCHSDSVQSKGNPNPRNYKILEEEDFGTTVLARVKYSDCTNFEGEKLLVYIKDSWIAVRNNGYIDPHFMEPDGGESKGPIARFIPTREGHWWATNFCKSINWK